MGRPRLSPDEKRRRKAQQQANWYARAGVLTRSTIASEPAPDRSRSDTAPVRVQSPARAVSDGSHARPASPPATARLPVDPLTGLCRDRSKNEDLPSPITHEDGFDGDNSTYTPYIDDDRGPIDSAAGPIYNAFGRKPTLLWPTKLLSILIKSTMAILRLIIRCCRIRRRR
jgi:hypothetical protein